MTKQSAKERLDTLLVARGLAESRQKARGLIMAGRVLVDDVRTDKPGRQVAADCEIVIREGIDYVSRGGIKLKGALDGLRIDPRGLTVLDAGASTGGFTDCLLAHRAARVIAADVGYGQLDWRLRSDPRVTVMERTNIRTLTRDELPCTVHAAVADLSFISLKTVLPPIAQLLEPGGWILALVKPQFEVGKKDVGKGGVVKDPAKIREAVYSVRSFCEVCGWEILGEHPSPIKGPKGNQEIFLYIRVPA